MYICSITVCMMYINVERILPIHRWTHTSVSQTREQFRASNIACLIVDCVRKQENFEGHTCKTSRLNWTYNLPARKKNFIPEESFLHTSDRKLRIAHFWISSNVYDCSCERVSPHRGNVIFTRMTRRWLVGQVAKVIVWLKGTWLATTEGQGSYKKAVTLKKLLFANS